MLSFIYKIYFIKFSHQLADQYFCRLIISLSNYLLPIYFRLSGWSVKKLHRNNKLPRQPVIVSLTSFPARINMVWLTIETILRQKEKPFKLILYLYKGEFNGRESLPKSLLRLEKRGLEIEFCEENLMPHKKYYYAMHKYPEASVIIIDDDMLYPTDLISKLKYYSKLYPNTIVCPIAIKIDVTNGEIHPYRNWDYINYNTRPGFPYLMIGAGSVYYPPRALHNEVFNQPALKEMALSADDLWLKIMSVKNNTRVVCIAGEYKRFFIPIRIKNNINLMDINIAGGQNDVIFTKLIDHYQIPVNIFKE